MAFALFLVGDGNSFYPKHRGDERGEGSKRTTISTSEYHPKRLALLLIGSLIEVKRYRPVSFSQRSRYICTYGHIQAIKWHVAVTPSIDVEGKAYITNSRCRFRGQGRVWRKETGTHYVTIAVLEIVSRDLPARLC